MYASIGLLRKLIAVPLCAVLLTGCHVRQVNIQGGCTQAPNGRTCTISIGIVVDPPGSDLSSFDTSQGLMAMSLSNATLSSTTGNFSLRVKDLTTGSIVGQQSFGYVVRGSSFYAQDPTAVHNWLQQFAGYSDVDVLVDLAPTAETTSAGSASAITSAVYLGTTYASSTVSWEYTPPDPGGCGTPICPNQD